MRQRSPGADFRVCTVKIPAAWDRRQAGPGTCHICLWSMVALQVNNFLALSNSGCLVPPWSFIQLVCPSKVLQLGWDTSLSLPTLLQQSIVVSGFLIRGDQLSLPSESCISILLWPTHWSTSPEEHLSLVSTCLGSLPAGSKSL